MMPYSSWLARCLPYLDQDGLWQKIERDFRIEPNPFCNPPHDTSSVAAKTWQCLSDERVRTAQYTHENYYVGLTSYVGVNGTNMRNEDGVLYNHSRTKMSDVLDGVCTTLVVGERPPGPDFWLGWWYVSGTNGMRGSSEFLLGANEFNIVGKYDYLYCAYGHINSKEEDLAILVQSFISGVSTLLARIFLWWMVPSIFCSTLRVRFFRL